MKRYVPVLVAAVMVLGTAGACEPPPPPGWKPPVIDSVVVNPESVEAGATFTVDIAASDDKLVQTLGYRFSQPNNQLPADRGTNTATLSCAHTGTPAGPTRQMQVTCTVPDYALVGTWEVVVNATDGEWSGGHGAGVGVGRASFEVFGGTNDDRAPVMESVTFAPDPVPAGGPFTVTLRASDENFPNPQAWAKAAYVFSGPPGKVWCEQVSAQVLSPTLHEWVLECPANPDLVPGTYSVQVSAVDINGNSDAIWVDMEVAGG